MAEALKNKFDEQFILPFSEVCKIHISSFNKEQFIKTVFSDQWKSLELKARIKHIAAALHKQLTNSIPHNLAIITTIAEYIRVSQNKQDTFEYVVLCDYIENYGLEYLYESLAAIEKVTVLSSCEFAIRAFIIRYPKETFAKLEEWSKHSHASVRRLSSEGSRPRLPWGKGIAFLKKDPSPIIPILNNLKDDNSLYVRRSVANNINDISKDHPTTVLTLLKNWYGCSKDRDWLVKHAARTLLKKGDRKALALFGYGDSSNLQLNGFLLQSKVVRIGDYLTFNFSIKNTANHNQKVRLEYFIHFLLANGTLSKKIFKISERELHQNETLTYKRRQSFKIISTRTYYTGEHKVSLVVNGIEFESLNFNLIN